MTIFTKNNKHLLGALFLLYSFLGFSQVPMEKVLVEMGTATWNMDCSQEVQIIEQMKDNGLEIVVLNYHLNDNFANQFANQRASYYDMQSLPYPVVGGLEAIVDDYDSYLSLYNEAINTPSSFNITTSAVFSEDSLMINVEIEKVTSYFDHEMSVYIAVSETNIPYNWFANSEVDDVERAMAPDGNGLDLDFSESNTVSFNTKILFSENWNIQEMNLVVFIQDEENHKILQCINQEITDFAPLPVHARFAVEDTLICGKEYISFQNLSIGGIESSHWFFTGGTPNESTDFEPQVQYVQAGAYAVKLAVANSVSTDTLTIEDFIHVKELPQMSFDAFPDFCHDEESYTLIEGHPEGGQYLGNFVDNGYFYPQEAGIGSHEIRYTIQHEETYCWDTIYQEAIVDYCEAVDEIHNSEDFPMLVYKINNRISLSQKSNSKEMIQNIQVVNLNGSLLYDQYFGGSQKININIFLPANNLILIIYVITSERKYILKYYY